MHRGNIIFVVEDGQEPPLQTVIASHRDSNGHKKVYESGPLTSTIEATPSTPKTVRSKYLGVISQAARKGKFFSENQQYQRVYFLTGIEKRIMDWHKNVVF